MPADHAAKTTRAKRGRTKLKQAFREDWAAKRFRVEYQPQVDLRTRRIVRFEALLRWDRVAKELVSPKYFIPLAEEMGMIGEIGQWVLEQACAEAMQWPAEIGIAVNVSAMALPYAVLATKVHHALVTSGLPASRLELEITESNELVVDPASISTLNAIRELGVRLTIDDLDVGHSSFRYLLDFSFDKIKMDGLYAAALSRPDDRGKAARAIMRLVAQLCREIDIDSLAEGVETPEQLALVMEAGFTEVQGYIFGESVTPDKVWESLQQVETIWKDLAIP